MMQWIAISQDIDGATAEIRHMLNRVRQKIELVGQPPADVDRSSCRYAAPIVRPRKDTEMYSSIQRDS